MIRDERLEKINAYVNLKKYVSVHELQEVFGISKATIRRDLDSLSQTDRIMLSRGGARCLQKPHKELPYDEKRKEMRDEKTRICAAACEQIREGSTVLIDTGTTTREMVSFLMTRKNIHIVTNDIMIATELAANCDIDVTVTGGTLRTGYYTLKGYVSENFLNQLHVDIAFLSLDAVDFNRGIMITNLEEISSKQSIIRCADYIIALCDHGKYEKSALCKVCNLEAVDLYITGKELPKELFRSFESKGLQIKLV